MNRQPKRKRIRVERFMLLVGMALFVFVVLIRGLVSLVTPKEVVSPLPQETTDPRILHSYDWTNLTNENGLFYYEDETCTSKIGMDVSYAQKDIKWSEVQKDTDIQFVMVRVGYRGYETGELHEDEQFQNNINGAISIGLPVGVYFFSHAITIEEAKEDAQFVLERIQNYPITYPVAFDMEEVSDHDRIDSLSKQEKTEIALAFCRTIQEAGYTPIVYGNAYWLKEVIDVSQLQDEVPFWLASYQSKAPSYPFQFLMWQFTEKGKVKGISELVDLNLFFEKR